MTTAEDIDRVQVELAELAAKTEGPEVLLEREHSGLRVELRWARATGATAILVEDADGFHGVEVAPELALDAFHHPYVYLPV